MPLARYQQAACGRPCLDALPGVVAVLAWTHVGLGLDHDRGHQPGARHVHCRERRVSVVSFVKRLYAELQPRPALVSFYEQLQETNLQA